MCECELEASAPRVSVSWRPLCPCVSVSWRRPALTCECELEASVPTCELEALCTHVFECELEALCTWD